MDNSEKNGHRHTQSRPKTLAGVLVSALNMEDEISNGVYRDYLNPKNWPPNLTPDAFKAIREYLTILIEDTKRHKKILAALSIDHDKDNQSSQV